MSSETLLHAARLSSGLSLDDVVRRTRLSPRIARALDEGRFAELPGGLYARSYVRAFAAVVAADARAIEEQVMPMLPGIEEPIAVVRAIAEQAEAHCGGERRLTAICAAACVDALLLFAMNGALVSFVAAVCRVTPGDLLAGGAGVSAVCGLATVSYFILFAGIDGRTPGRALCRLPRLNAAGPLRVRQILDRAARIGLEEASLVLTWTEGSLRRSG